jgi:HAD superfamily hydrolase (TIGR01509 family)
MIKAILFDMDGVLSNSEPHHISAFKIFFKKKGIPLSKTDVKDIFGRFDDDIIRDLCKKKGVKCNVNKWYWEKRKIVVSLLKKMPIPSFPDAIRLVKRVSRKYKVGIGTSSSREEVNIVLKKLGIRKYFDRILGREDVKHHKPSPELYLKLAKKLKAKPSECVVIEDSVVGVIAAKRAGMKCIAVLNSFPASKLKKADLIVKSLNDKRVTNLLEL